MPNIMYEVQEYNRYNRRPSRWESVELYQVDDNEGECRRCAVASMGYWAITFPEKLYRVVRVEEVEHS